MKKKLPCILLAALLCLLPLSGCAEAPENGSGGITSSNPPKEDGTASPNLPEEAVLPEIESDFFAVLCEHTDVVFGNLSYSNQLDFTVLSAQLLSTEDIEVSFDQDISFEYTLHLNEELADFSYVTFATYQGISWTEVAALYQAGQSKEAEALFDSFQESANALSSDEIPALYTGTLTLNFLNFREWDDVNLKSMTVTAGGKSTTYDLERVAFDHSAVDIFDDGGLQCDSLAIFDFPLEPSTDGAFEAVKNLPFFAAEAVQIDRIYFYDAPDTVIDTIAVSQTLSDGNTMDYVWDGSTPLSLAKDEAIAVTITAHDPLFANTATANASRYLMVDYTCGGTQNTTYVELDYRLRIDGYDAYAALYDGLDSLSYYTARISERMAEIYAQEQ